MSHAKKKVSPIVASPKHVAADVLHFLESKAARSEIPAQPARQRVMALRQLIDVLRDDEPRELAWMNANLEAIADRWAKLNPQRRSATARTYMTRARASIQDFERWSRDPAAWTFKQRRSPAPRRPRIVAAARSFPLADGRPFTFVLPEGGLMMKDVRRIAAHLSSFAADFEAVIADELPQIQGPSNAERKKSP